MVELGNQEVMNLWTFYPEQSYTVMTSNVQGYVYNPSLNDGTGNPAYFAYLS